MQPANGYGSQCASVKLAFSANIEQPGLEGNRGGKPGQDERNRARVSVSLSAKTEPKPPLNSKP